MWRFVGFNDEREETVVLAKACGETFKRIGEYYGVSPQRANQIYQKTYRRIATTRRLMHVRVIELGGGGWANPEVADSASSA